ncbi:MAG TPA: tetrameric acyl-CoA thioesterase, partial [Enteractinococcus sp.]
MKLPKFKIPTYASMRIGPKFLQRFMRIWPPYFGAGIKPEYIAEDASRSIVTHKPNVFTRNLVGTAFGGTMLAMTDPFFMFAGVYGLGKEYLVWDVGVE